MADRKKNYQKKDIKKDQEGTREEKAVHGQDESLREAFLKMQDDIPEEEPVREPAGNLEEPVREPVDIPEEKPVREPADIPVEELVQKPADIPEKEPVSVNVWMKDIMDGLERFGKKGSADEPAAVDAEDQGQQGPPAPTKDEMQKQLADMKAGLEHTPMEMTPDLQRLLSGDIKEHGKKDKNRAAQMIGVLAGHNFYANGLTPEELRTTLEDLGPTYVKIGQIMSSRVDLLPESYCKELEKLRQNVKEMDPAVARAIIEAETGKKIDEIFSEFRDKPIGSASIGQVHYGVLRDGTKVVTKVQRPLIAEMMDKDFQLLKKLAPMVGGVAPAEDGADALDLVTIVNEFEKVTKEELDFRVEAANTRFFKEAILKDGPVTCPTVIDELTTERIFTMTYVDGCSISKMEELPDQGIDPEKAGRDILESYVHQVFDVGIFHADPHQGNIMCSNGEVYWIDFGMIGQITEADMKALTELVVGLLKGDAEEMANGVLAIGTSSAGTDRNKLKEDLEAFSTKYMSVTSLNDVDFSAVLGEVCDLADKHHIVMPGRYTMLARSFLTIEGVMEQLCPELNLFELVSDKLVDRMKKTFSLEKEILSLGQGALDIGKKASKIPQLVSDALSDIMKGRLKVNLELTGYDDLLQQLNEKIDDIILVLVGCVLFSGGCRLCATDIYPKTPNGMPVFAAIILIIGISLIIFALKRIFRKKK